MIDVKIGLATGSVGQFGERFRGLRVMHFHKTNSVRGSLVGADNTKAISHNGLAICGRALSTLLLARLFLFRSYSRREPSSYALRREFFASFAKSRLARSKERNL